MILLWLLGLVVMIALFGLVARAVLAILRVSLAVLAALALALVTTSLLGLDPATDVQSFAGVFLLGLMALLWFAFRRRECHGALAERRLGGLDDAPLKRPSEPRPLTRAEPDPLARLEAAGRISRWGGRRERDAAAERKLAVSWSILEQVGEGHRARIAVAKTGCERLLAFAGSGIPSSSVQDALIGIRKGVPELTETCVRHMMSVADVADRAGAVSQAVETLEHIAARAERESDALARDRAAAFDLARAHLRQRSNEDRLSI